MDSVMQDIYPKELELTSDDAVTSTHYLDLDLETLMKRSTTTFTTSVMRLDSIVNFPNMSGNIPANKAMEFLLHSWSDMHAVVNIFDILLNVQSF